MIRDLDMDNIIIDELKGGPKYTGEILRAINKRRESEGRELTTIRTVDIHLDDLKKVGIIGRDPGQPVGKKRYCWIINAKDFERKLGFDVVPTRRKERDSIRDTKQKRITRAIILLISLATRGSIRAKPVKDRKAEPGDVVLASRKTGKAETVSLDTLTGVCVEDIAKHELLDYMHKISYTALSEQEIKSLLQTLEAESIMAKAHQTEGKTSYKIADEQWGTFILDCSILLQDVVAWMELYWACVRDVHPYHQQAQVRWYYTVVGEEQAQRFFLNGKEKMKNDKLRHINMILELLFKDKELANKENLFKKITQEIIKDEIQRLDKIILCKIHKIDEEDWTIANSEGYENVRDKHKVIFSIMRNIIYPPFLEKLLHQEQV